jgi:thioredoxin reductase (NADPH)
MNEKTLDLLVIGAGPTGIAVGAEARKSGLSVLLVDRGPLVASIVDFPTFLTFFTTRDRMEIAGIPMSIPEDKPTRQQALAYYRSIVERFDIPISLHENVLHAKKEGAVFKVESVRDGKPITRFAKNVVIATGFFGNPLPINVPGSDLPWVKRQYVDAYRHFGENVLVIGGANSAVKTALELWRNGVKVTLAVRAPAVRDSVKFWLKPDIENRIKEGSIRAFFNAQVKAFHNDPRGAELEINTPGQTPKTLILPCDTAFAFIGYRPDVDLERRCGVQVDPKTLVPNFNPDTCESNVPGLFVAGTILAGLDTDKIFIENSRDHGETIVKRIMST